jgi:hypothetical protein
MLLKKSLMSTHKTQNITWEGGDIEYCDLDNGIDKYEYFKTQFQKLLDNRTQLKLNKFEKTQLKKYMEYLEEDYNTELESATDEGYTDLCTPDEDENTPSAPPALSAPVRSARSAQVAPANHSNTNTTVLNQSIVNAEIAAAQKGEGWVNETQRGNDTEGGMVVGKTREIQIQDKKHEKRSGLKGKRAKQHRLGSTRKREQASAFAAHLEEGQSLNNILEA